MIKTRVIQLIEYKGVAKEVFFRKIGISSANFRGSAANTPLNSTAIENIFTQFPDLNLEWLITGNGEMLKSPQGPQSDTIYKSDPRDAEMISLQRKQIQLLEDRIAQIEEKSALGLDSAPTVDYTPPLMGAPLHPKTLRSTRK